MKKVVLFIVVGVLISSAIGAAHLAPQVQQTKPQITQTFSHTILGEMETAFWCQYCKYAHEALRNIYGAEWYPFYYVSLETAKNSHAMARALELGYGGLPRVFFDGGFRLDMGAPNTPAAQNAYNASIQASGNRTVSDVDLQLDVIWLGDATMSVTVHVQNNEATDYLGKLRVYVTEISSSMGWNDSGGHPYTFVFLDYAVNDSITVPASDTWETTVTWDGHDYNDGHGHDFSGITQDNVMVIASIFDKDSTYVDETIGATPHSQNNPPYQPSNPDPEDGATDVLPVMVSWTGDDPDAGDSVTYNVYFGSSTTPDLVAENQTSTSFGLCGNPVDYDTAYYWKVVSWDSHGASTEGPLWSFTTMPAPDIMPPTVTITTPKEGYLYLFDKEIMKRVLSPTTLAIGPITIEVQAEDESGIDHVVFMIDGEQQADITGTPYQWIWEKSSGFAAHDITITAYDPSGNHASATMIIKKLL